jgi:hypothetical protein
VLVPRSSGTPMATWAWPTWVVSQRHVLEAVFVLLESPSPSRRIFIGSHLLPPSLVRRIDPSWVDKCLACLTREWLCLGYEMLLSSVYEMCMC